MKIDIEKENYTLQKIEYFDHKASEEESEKTIIFCNLVTTSLNEEIGELVRINLKPCFIKDGKIIRTRKSISFFQYPEKQIEKSSRKYIDFDLEEKRESSINWDLIRNLFSQADYIVSHNSSFIRPWVDKHIGQNDFVWGCSLEHIDWESRNFPNKNLESLCVFSGFYYDFSNSKTALEALVNCVHVNKAVSELVEKAESPDLQVFAANAPRELNYLLKSRRYRWNPDFSCWWTQVRNKEEADLESSWLAENLPGSEPQVFEVDSKFRYTK